MNFHCNICNSTKGRTLLKLPPSFFQGENNHLAAAGLYQNYCRGCGALINMAPKRVTAEFYQRSYKKKFADSADFFPTRRTHETKAAINANFIKQHIVPAGRMLEVGAHMGSLMAALKNIGWEVAGIEPSPSLCSLGGELYGLEIKNGFYDSESFLPQQFDLIAFDNVLEHVDAPLELISAAHLHLKPGGFIFFILPVLETIRTNQIGGWHLTILSYKNWEHIIAQCGFTTKHLVLDGLGGGDSARLRCLAMKTGGWPAKIKFSQRNSYLYSLAKLIKMIAAHKVRGALP